MDWLVERANSLEATIIENMKSIETATDFLDIDSDNKNYNSGIVEKNLSSLSAATAATMSSEETPMGASATNNDDNNNSDDDSMNKINTSATNNDNNEGDTNNNSKIFHRSSSSFLRVADLDVESILSSSSIERNDNDEDTSQLPNFSVAANDPPPGMNHDPLELWVALDDGIYDNTDNNKTPKHSPMAPVAVQALAKKGYQITMKDKDMWTFKKAPVPQWEVFCWHEDKTNDEIKIPNISDLPEKGSKEEEQVLLWIGKFNHKFYGHELPLGRSAAIIHMNPKDLCDLLVDSTRVKEYNKLSLGRNDILILQEEMSKSSSVVDDDNTGPFQGITKIISSKSSPPVIRKDMEFISLFHTRELPNNAGYLIVTRAVHNNSNKNAKKIIRGEILMNVNVIIKIYGDENRCLMVSIFHLKSGTSVPMAIANQIVPKSAVGFVKDIRSLCKNYDYNKKTNDKNENNDQQQQQPKKKNFFSRK